MAKWRCSLCGGKLSNGRCTLCGLDNTVYKRKIAYSGNTPQDKSAQEQKTHAGTEAARQISQPNTDTKRTAPVARRKKGKSSRLPVIVILIIILAAVLPTVIEIVQTVIQDISSDSAAVSDTYFGDSYDEDFSADYDPYEYVTREIPDTGETWETVLGNGIYRVGVHVPEGVYRAEVVEGAGSVAITDEENYIYDSVFLGTEEEYGQSPEEEDIRLYNGADLQIDSGVIVKLSTENAQPLVKETSENPLTESVSLQEGTYVSGDGTIPEGVYDLSVKTAEGDYGYSSITLLYPDGDSRYLWAEGPDYAVTSSQYTDISVRNIVIPEGTEVSVEYGDVVLTPSAGYYDVDYSEYEGE